MEHVERFQKVNKIRPQRILFYRDGVSEGRFQQVLKFELAQIKAGAEEIDPAYAPTITMILGFRNVITLDSSLQINRELLIALVMSRQVLSLTQ